MYAWFAVAMGGALGSVARHGVNRIVHQEWPLLRFPIATVIVNIVGCCVIGVLAGLVSGAARQAIPGGDTELARLESDAAIHPSLLQIAADLHVVAHKPDRDHDAPR